MENEKQFAVEINKCFDGMKNLIDESFSILKHTPSEKENIEDMWKSKISEFISYTFKASEKNKDKDIFKAITKVVAFRK